MIVIDIESEEVVAEVVGGAPEVVVIDRGRPTLEILTEASLVTRPGGLDQDAADARYINVDGDTMTGALVVPAPVTGGDAANKGYVDTGLAGKADTSHTHALGDLPGTLATDAEVAAAITAHEGAANPHPDYLLATEVAAVQVPTWFDLPVTGDYVGQFCITMDSGLWYQWMPSGIWVEAYTPGMLWKRGAVLMRSRWAVKQLEPTADGQVLVADSTLDDGIKWAAPAAGGLDQAAVPVVASGLWFPLWAYSGISSQAFATGLLRVSRVLVRQAAQTIQIDVNTGAATNVTAVAYADNNGAPGSRVLASVAMDVSGAGARSATFNLAPGMYWIGVQNTGSASVNLRCSSGLNPLLSGLDTPGSNNLPNCWQVTGQGTSTPAVFPIGSVARTGLNPAIFLQAT